MEMKPYEVIAQELALAKDTLLNEVMHRQQLASQLKSAAMNASSFQNLAANNLREIRAAVNERRYVDALSIIDRSIGPEQTAATEQQAAE